MKLNKKRFAALALSAVMAVGTMSVPTFAAEVKTVADEKISDTGVVTWNWVINGVKYPDSAQANELVAPATCTTDKSVYYSYTIKGTDKDTVVDKTVTFSGTKLNHDVSVTQSQVFTAATEHGSTGVMEVWKECVRFEDCGEKTDSEYVPYDGPAHAYEEVYVTIAGKNLEMESEELAAGTGIYEVALKDGNFQLKDNKLKGEYAIFDVCTDEECKKNNIAGWYAITDGKWYVVNPTEWTSAEVIAVDNVKSPEIGDSHSTDINAPLPSKSVQLKDCDEPGSYTVGYYADGVEIETKTFYYDAHHAWGSSSAIKYTPAADSKWCDADTDEDTGLYTVEENKSCKEIDYTVTATCAACGEKYEEDFVAEPTGEHAVPTTLKELLEGAIELDDEFTYADLEKFVTDNVALGSKKKMYVPEDPFACDEEGILTVDFLCTVCDEYVDGLDVLLAAKGHKKATPAIENEVNPDPECSGDSTYEKVVYCANENCEYEFSRETVTIERTKKHSNEKTVGTDNVAHTDGSEIVRFEYTGDVVVNIANEKDGVRKQLGSGTYEGKNLFVKINPVSVCKEECGHEVLVDKDVHVSDIEIVKEDAEGHAGTVSCTISYTYTPAGKTKPVTYEEYAEFPYFSSVYAWLNRVEEVEPEPEPVKDGVVLDDDGVFRFYEDGEFIDYYTDWADFGGATFYFVDGELATEMDGLTQIDGQWYVFSGGMFREDITDQAVYYDNALFWVKDGMLDTEKNGVYLYDGALCLFAGGRWASETNGIALMPNGTFYYFVEGIVATHFTGIEAYNGANFYVKSGKIDFTKNGTVVYEGQTWNVVDGAATLVK